MTVGAGRRIRADTAIEDFLEISVTKGADQGRGVIGRVSWSPPSYKRGDLRGVL